MKLLEYVRTKELFLSPEQLGEKVGVSGMTIRRLEQGHGEGSPHLRTQGRLATAVTALRQEITPGADPVNFDDLLREVDPPFEPGGESPSVGTREAA